MVRVAARWRLRKTPRRSLREVGTRGRMRALEDRKCWGSAVSRLGWGRSGLARRGVGEGGYLGFPEEARW